MLQSDVSKILGPTTGSFTQEKKMRRFKKKN